MDAGYYKCSVITDGVINDINTSCWFDMLFDGNNTKIYDIKNTGFSWHINSGSSYSKSITVDCAYPSNYANFAFMYWRIY
jgi:hypothetical protein